MGTAQEKVKTKKLFAAHSGLVERYTRSFLKVSRPRHRTQRKQSLNHINGGLR